MFAFTTDIVIHVEHTVIAFTMDIITEVEDVTVAFTPDHIHGRWLRGWRRRARRAARVTR